MTVVGYSMSDESERSLLRVEESVDIWRRRRGERREGKSARVLLPSSLCLARALGRTGEKDLDL